MHIKKIFLLPLPFKKIETIILHYIELLLMIQ